LVLQVEILEQQVPSFHSFCELFSKFWSKLVTIKGLYCIHRVWISGDWLIWKPYICMFQVKSLQIQDVSAAIAHYDHELHRVRLYHFFLNMVALWRSLVSEMWAYEVMSVICACHAWLHPITHTIAFHFGNLNPHQVPKYWKVNSVIQLCYQELGSVLYRWELH
jgi:hypothetical protein